MSWWKDSLPLLVVVSLIGSTELPSSDITISVERMIDISTQVISISYFPKIYWPFSATSLLTNSMDVF